MCMPKIKVYIFFNNAHFPNQIMRIYLPQYAVLFFDKKSDIEFRILTHTHFMHHRYLSWFTLLYFFLLHQNHSLGSGRVTSRDPVEGNPTGHLTNIPGYCVVLGLLLNPSLPDKTCSSCHSLPSSLSKG